MNSRFVIYGNGKTKHIYAPIIKGERSGTECQMFWKTEQLREATNKEANELPICGACCRAVHGRLIGIPGCNDRTSG